MMKTQVTQQRCGAIASIHSSLKGFIQATPVPKQLLYLDPELDSAVVVMCFSLIGGATHTHTEYIAIQPISPGKSLRTEVVSSTVLSHIQPLVLN